METGKNPGLTPGQADGIAERAVPAVSDNSLQIAGSFTLLSEKASDNRHILL